MQHNTSLITSKGQIVIPAWLRKKMGLTPGTRVSFLEQGQSIVIQPQTPEYFDSMVGILGKDSKMLEILLDERRKDAIKETKKARGKARS